MSRPRLLTSGAVGPLLLRLAAPMLIGTFSIVAFNLTDTYFVSQLGTTSLAAISFTFPVIMVVGSIALGLGVGASAVISQAIGAGNERRVRRLTTDSLVLAVTIVAVISTVGYFTIDPLFRALGADDVVMPQIESFMTIWYVGMVFVVVPMVGNNAMRATGDTLTPALIMATGAGVNIVLDPILIFGLVGAPRMGISGAALATVIARSCTLTAALWVLGRRKHMLDRSRPSGCDVLRSWFEVLHVGIPAAGTRLLTPISMGIFTRLVAEYGRESVAAVGAGSRLEGFAMIVIMAIASALVPFVGQNWGAGERDRAALGTTRGSQYAVTWGAVCVIVLAALSGPLARAFSDDPVVIERITLFLWIVPLGYGLQGVSILVGSAFNAMRSPGRSLWLSVVRLFALFLPLAFVGSLVFGFVGLLVGVAAANVLAGVVAWLWVRAAMAKDAAARAGGAPA